MALVPGLVRWCHGCNSCGGRLGDAHRVELVSQVVLASGSSEGRANRTLGSIVKPVGNFLLGLQERAHERTSELAIEFAILVEEADGLACVAASTGSADSVHVVVDRFGQVEIDDMRHMGNVEASGSD